MAKYLPFIILEPVDVKCSTTTPVEFLWRNSRYKVEVERRWYEVERKWYKVEEKAYYQVRHGDGIYLLLHKGDNWFIQRTIK